jgi:hypothetical protein
MSPSHRRAECLYIEVFTHPSETRSPSIGEWIRFEWPIREETVPQSCWWPTIASRPTMEGPMKSRDTPSRPFCNEVHRFVGFVNASSELL